MVAQSEQGEEGEVFRRPMKPPRHSNSRESDKLLAAAGGLFDNNTNNAMSEFYPSFATKDPRKRKDGSSESG